MRSWLFVLAMSGSALAGPKLPPSPGNPPKLDKAPDKVTLVHRGKATVLDVWIEGRSDTWTMKLLNNDAHVAAELVLPKLAPGTFKGDKSKLTINVDKPYMGRWIVEITEASPGYLKGPGPCSGKVALWVDKTTYVTGAFKSAGCMAYDPPPNPNAKP